MLVWVTAGVAVVLWVGLIYSLQRYLRRGRIEGRESDLRFELAAAPWSDTHVEAMLRKAPDSPTVLNQYAFNAIDRREWAEAERRLALFRQRAPKVAGPWLCEIEMLRRRDQPAEARALLERALRRRPRDPEILLVAARHALWAREWQEAASGYARLRSVAPMRWEGYSEGAEALAEIGEAEAAAVLLATAMRTLPQECRIWQAAARIAERRGDMPEALRDWHELRERFPGEAEGYLGGAAALERAGENEAARRVLQLGCDYLPGNKNMRAALERVAPPPTEQPATGA